MQKNHRNLPHLNSSCQALHDSLMISQHRHGDLASSGESYCKIVLCLLIQFMEPSLCGDAKQCKAFLWISQHRHDCLASSLESDCNIVLCLLIRLMEPLLCGDAKP